MTLLFQLHLAKALFTKGVVNSARGRPFVVFAACQLCDDLGTVDLGQVWFGAQPAHPTWAVSGAFWV